VGGASLLISWRVARGVSLHATDHGIVAEGSRVFRIRLKQQALEIPLVEALATGDFAAARDRFTSEAVDAALAALEQQDAIVRVRRTIAIADRIEANVSSDVDAVSLVEYGEQLRDAELLVVLARRADAAVGDLVAAARTRGMSVLMGWLDRREIVFCAQEARRSPCVLCALRFDAGAARTLVPESDLAEQRAFGDADARKLIQGFVARFSTAPSDLPAAGRAFIFDIETCESRWETFSRHPSCTCDTAFDEPATFLDRAPDWEELAGRRFAPVVPVDRGDEQGRPARVLYRGSRSPWPVSRDSYGVAIASGARAADRSLAEAFERFSMLHAPPDILGRSATNLDAASLDPLSIASLLHGDEQYARADFRFPRYSNELVLDWSWAECAGGQGRLLVPTSLIGRPCRGSVRLVDATSNGYACHPSREEARTLALLEVLERDAALIAWYADDALPHVEGLDIPQGAVALLATQDVDIPAVVLAMCAEDGSLRTAASASLDFDGAVEAALRELRGQLLVRTDPMKKATVSLDGITARYGPQDHASFYAGSRGREALGHMTRGQTKLDAHDLRTRWPHRSGGGDRFAALIDIVHGAGLEPLFVDRSLPDLSGRWRVTRALVPRTVEISWGQSYRRLASPRLLARLEGRTPSTWPHPFG
jgi:thiazole/oxazole-forming peptide maturase SagD family component